MNGTVTRRILRTTNVSVNSSMSHYHYDPARSRNFILKYYRDYLDNYDKSTPTDKKTIFIYLWLYHYGGVYIGDRFDIIDHTVIDDLMRTYDLVFMHDEKLRISTDLIMSAKKNEVLKQLVDSMSAEHTISIENILNDCVWYSVKRSEIDPYATCPIGLKVKKNRIADMIGKAACNRGVEDVDTVYYGAGLIVLLFLIVVLILVNL